MQSSGGAHFLLTNRSYRGTCNVRTIIWLHVVQFQIQYLDIRSYLRRILKYIEYLESYHYNYN